MSNEILPTKQRNGYLRYAPSVCSVSSTSHELASATKRVLVLDGGCIRGLGCLFLLEELSKRIGEDPCAFFDLICGSGCGGLLAILLGRLRMNCQAAIGAYKKLVTALCGTQATDFHRRLFEGDGLLNSSEFSKALSDILESHGSDTNNMLAGELEYDDGANVSYFRLPSAHFLISLSQDFCHHRAQ